MKERIVNFFAGFLIVLGVLVVYALVPLLIYYITESNGWQGATCGLLLVADICCLVQITECIGEHLKED